MINKVSAVKPKKELVKSMLPDSDAKAEKEQNEDKTKAIINLNITIGSHVTFK